MGFFTPPSCTLLKHAATLRHRSTHTPQVFHGIGIYPWRVGEPSHGNTLSPASVSLLTFDMCQSDSQAPPPCPATKGKKTSHALIAIRDITGREASLRSEGAAGGIRKNDLCSLPRTYARWAPYGEFRRVAVYGLARLGGFMLRNEGADVQGYVR